MPPFRIEPEPARINVSPAMRLNLPPVCLAGLIVAGFTDASAAPRRKD